MRLKYLIPSPCPLTSAKSGLSDLTGTDGVVRRAILVFTPCIIIHGQTLIQSESGKIEVTNKRILMETEVCTTCAARLH